MHNTMENREKFENIEQRVLEAKSNRAELNSLIDEYIPFIRKAALKVIPSSEYSSYSSTAMAAFAEAVQKFRDSEGKFLGFASLVITNRIKDQIRKEFKPKEIPSDEIEIIASFDEKIDRKMEIDMFRGDLTNYGIFLDDLLKDSPKHRGSRLKANKAAKFLADSDFLFNILVKTKKLPLKRLSELAGVSEKLLEQKRKYIIARALLRQNKYSYLREYVK